MKKYQIWLTSILVSTMPLVASAQSNIKSAFENIIKCPEAEISENHHLEKDPHTGIKTGQSDVYNFILPADKMYLIKNVIAAFEKDSDKAYGIDSGNGGANRPLISLAVGTEASTGVKINDEKGKYEYALFLAPKSEDSTGNYRYAYGISYNEVNGQITGKLVVTYATTMAYRQQMQRKRKNEIIGGFSNGAYIINSYDVDQNTSWFETIMKYIQSMTSAKSQSRIAIASRMFSLIEKSSQYNATAAEKAAVKKILKGMIEDKNYSETVLHQLLVQCEESLN